MRLALFLDQVFWTDGGVISSDESYVLFPASFAAVTTGIDIVGRAAPAPGRAPYVLDMPGVSVLTLPHYPSLWSMARGIASAPRILSAATRIIEANARRWDYVLISGPHPVGQWFARCCMSHGLPVALVVRQNLAEQMGTRRGWKRPAAVAAAHLLEWDFLRLARGRPVFTVGEAMARRYTRVSHSVHPHFASLIDDAQFERLSARAGKGEPRRLLYVGRLEAERGHEILFDAMAQLRSRGLDVALDIVGSGPLERHLRQRAADLGLAGSIAFHGYVPYGPALFELYAHAGIFVLPSFSEGFPQVLNEALSAGLAIVASAVGGIPDVLADRHTAMLVPPGDPTALATAIAALVTDPVLRARLAAAGRDLMRTNTLEFNRSRILGVLRDDIASRSRSTPIRADGPALAAVGSSIRRNRRPDLQ